MSNNSLHRELLLKYLNYLEFEKRSSKHTVVSYSNDILNFLQSVEPIDIDKIQDSHIRVWIVSLSENNHSPRSINRKITAVRSFFVYLQKFDIIQKNPAAKIHALKTKKRLPLFIEKKNMSNLFNEVVFEDNFVGLRDKLILDLLYSTGMRRAELVSLQISSFDFGNKTVKILGKRNKERIVPIVPELISCIQKYLQERAKIAQSNTYVILTEKGAPAYEQMIYRIVKKYLGQVTTLDKKSPHILRHTCATHLLNNGADLHDIKELLGHANLSATQIYTHNSFEKLKDIYKQSHPRN
ncbi:MAG TPA: tyrosine-type recombinase/integrase [Bacteroidales bacterium]|nr:tyrosine-type recombinase/integrase [Bacteroidales bacterium]